MQGIKEIAYSTIKPLKDSATHWNPPGKFSGGINSTAPGKFSGDIHSTVPKLTKSKQPDDSLRIVMYLSCWGPN